ncbi:hypothetical protein FRC03_012484 [Tulasnella sp. 419]|nr:hypothetical protein FRC03_012484 [Tulasnella sp. 419]
MIYLEPTGREIDGSSCRVRYLRVLLAKYLTQRSPSRYSNRRGGWWEGSTSGLRFVIWLSLVE